MTELYHDRSQCQAFVNTALRAIKVTFIKFLSCIRFGPDEGRILDVVLRENGARNYG